MVYLGVSQGALGFGHCKLSQVSTLGTKENTRLKYIMELWSRHPFSCSNDGNLDSCNTLSNYFTIVADRIRDHRFYRGEVR